MTIEEATVVVRPLGAYCEVGYYLTFSARSSRWYGSSDSLEIWYDFRLPAGSHIHDSWVWLGDKIIQAKLFKKYPPFVAGVPYNRRKDPSILTKTALNSYKLEIYPMAGNQMRRAKITYLVPVDWRNRLAIVPLPVDLLALSANIPKVKYLVATNQFGQNPTLNDGTELKPKPDLPGWYQANYDGAPLPADLKLRYETFTGDYQVSVYQEKSNEGYYQIALAPQVLADVPTRKLVFLLDYDVAGGGSINRPRLLNEIRALIQDNLTQKDSFNIICSNTNVVRASDKWLPADKLTIQSVFEDLQNALSETTNLKPLMLNGFQFVKQNGGTGRIVLVSNANHLTSIQVCNSLFHEVALSIPPNVPVYTLDYYANKLIITTPQGNYNYVNAYFLEKLATETKGAFIKSPLNGLYKPLDAAFPNMYPGIENFDWHLGLATGLCYNQFAISNGAAVASLNKPVVQIGQYKGDFPLRVQVSGTYANQPISKEIAIQAPEIVPSDNLLRKTWFGNEIYALENDPQYYSRQAEIMSNSFAARVLSRYTIFRCPEDTSNACTTCVDETLLTGVNPNLLRDSTLSAFPNPFRESVQIRIKNTGAVAQDARLDILNLEGRLVQSFSVALTGDETLVQWDGKTGGGLAVPAGIYIATLKTAHQSNTLKLVKQP